MVEFEACVYSLYSRMYLGTGQERWLQYCRSPVLVCITLEPRYLTNEISRSVDRLVTPVYVNLDNFVIHSDQRVV